MKHQKPHIRTSKRGKKFRAGKGVANHKSFLNRKWKKMAEDKARAGRTASEHQMDDILEEQENEEQKDTWRPVFETYPVSIIKDESWIDYLRTKGVKFSKSSGGKIVVMYPDRKTQKDIMNPYSYFWHTEMANSHKYMKDMVKLMFPEDFKDKPKLEEGDSTPNIDSENFRQANILRGIRLKNRQFSDKDLFSLDEWAPDGKVLLKDNNLALVYSKEQHPEKPFNIVHRADNPDPTVENWVDRIDLTKDYKSAKKIFDRENKRLKSRRLK